MNGGSTALFGFRYQLLRTVEHLIKLHIESPAEGWEIEIESATDEKVDYAEWRSGQLSRVVQVKASTPGASTRIRPKEALEILETLACRNPHAERVVVESNRVREGDWADFNRLSGASRRPVYVAEQDQRGIEDVEEDIEEALRRIRLSAGVSSDPTSLRHLAFVLEGRLLQLGSSPSSDATGAQRMVTASEFADFISISGQEIASLLGSVPWGRFWSVPTGERVVRNEALGWLSEALPESAIASPGPPAVACLTGFSGAGKTSAAAGWADVHQEQYGMVLWLPAQDEDSLTEAVRQLLYRASGEETQLWHMDRVRMRFLNMLASTPLAWLVVFDDAKSADLVHHWTPSRGFGHIVITSIDSTWPPSSAAPLEMPSMVDSEIRALIARRLGPDALSGEKEAVTHALGQLSAATGGWPLAIEMAIAWLARTGHPLSAIGEQLIRLSEILLDRNELVPVGYPRTVVAAVIDALDAVQSLSDPLPWQILLTCARLGSRNIPTQLLSNVLAAVSQDDARLDVAIGVLRESSLVQRDRFVAPIPGPWQDHLVVNQLIGDLALLLASEDVDSELRAWEVLDEALRTSLEDRQFHITASLSSPVSAVLEGVHRGERAVSLPGLTLHGNLATLHIERGELDQAEILLKREVSWAGSMVWTNALPGRVRLSAAKLALLAYVQLVQINVRSDRPVNALDAAEIVVDMLCGNKRALLGHEEKELLTALGASIEAIRHQECRDRRDQLLCRINHATNNHAPHRLQQIENSLRDAKIEAAYRMVKESLSLEEDPWVQLQLHAFRAECLAHLDPKAVPDILKLAMLTADALGAGHIHVETAAVQCGYVLFMRTLHEVQEKGFTAVIRNRESHADAIRSVLAYLPDVEKPQTPGDLVRTLITLAIHAVLIQAPNAARAIDRAISALDRNDGRISEEEITSLLITTRWLEALGRRMELTNVVEPIVVSRAGNKIMIGFDVRDLSLISRITPRQELSEVDVILWFVLVTVKGAHGEVTIWVDASRLPAHAFQLMDSTSTIVAHDAASMRPTSMGSPAIPREKLIELGHVHIALEAWVVDSLRAQGAPT